MQVDRTDQAGRGDVFPDPEIHAFVILPHHPAEKHVQAFAGGTFFRTGNMFPCTGRGVFQGEKVMMKTGQHCFYRCPVQGKSGFQAFVFTVMPFEKFNKKEFVDTAYFEPFYLKDFVAGISKRSLL